MAGEIVPPIAPRTAAALCSDDYTGIPALDDDMWQGASDNARSCYWEDQGGAWAFCYDDESGMLSAQNEDGEGARAHESGEWEPI